MNAGKFLKYLILLVVAGNLALVGYVFLGALTPKAIPMPNPNGYDDLVKAGKMLKGESFAFERMSQEELNTFVAQNADALKFAEVALGRECRMSGNYSPGYMLRYRDENWAIQDLSANFCARGKLAALEHRTNDAVESYLQCIRLGEKSSRGGFTISKTFGIICEQLGCIGLRPWTNSLDMHQCMKVSRTLETLDAQEEPFEENVRQDGIINRKTESLWEQFKGILEIGSVRNKRKKFITNFHRHPTAC